MNKSKEWLFDTDICLGRIIMNTLHQENVQQLSESILATIPCNNEPQIDILLNYWTYRLYDKVIVHALDFMTLSYQVVYTLTLTEGDDICFYPHSFSSNQGSITVIDTVDVNGFIHHLSQIFRNRNVRLIFSCLDMSK
ncbi:hypothetical protein [Rodentibacter haemolyticus]|uniref:Uncharacterized protein n=1 Tax=Rodentibacter haemolyticus TaxID=2778911 RepID=A0ABX6V0K1_9PAST|nr:hypothetical protein [Rodentibacter haemolyticus]QPB42871.1 hypothetical protein IHV77_01725 [Rodentibacter haemolyticus]